MKRVVLNYLYNLMLAASQFCNTLAGGDPDESISSRLGKNIARKGWASRVQWPRWLRVHFVRSVERDEGKDSAARRKTRV